MQQQATSQRGICADLFAIVEFQRICLSPIRIAARYFSDQGLLVRKFSQGHFDVWKNGAAVPPVKVTRQMWVRNQTASLPKPTRSGAMTSASTIIRSP